jgi:hypothetical protein
VRRRIATIVLAAALAGGAGSAEAAPAVTSIPSGGPTGPSVIVPGLSYQRVASGGRVSHVLRMRPGPLLHLEPVLTGGATSRRGTLSSALGALRPAGAVAGVNADYFNFARGFPSGVLVIDGELVAEPEASRSALAIGPGAALSVAPMALAASWRVVPVPGLPVPRWRSIQGVNRAAQRPSETLLYTPRYGAATPAGSRGEAVIAVDGGAAPTAGATLTGTVVATTARGGSPLGPGQVVLTGVGTAARPIASLAPGTRVTMSLGVRGLPPGTPDAIGGGPLLVRDGRAVPSAGEGFSRAQTDGATARTAVGQTAAGTVLLVTNEGPGLGARGRTVAQQAGLMASLGAVTAIGMDSGGSAEMAIGARSVIGRPQERPISDALVVTYDGVQLSAPALPIVSPNADRVDDATQATVHVPERGELTVTLRRRGGGAARVLARGVSDPGDRVLTLPHPGATLRDGAYRLHAALTPLDGSAPTSQERALVVNSTLASLRVRAVDGRRPRLRIGFVLRHASGVTVTVRDARGRVVGRPAAGRHMRAGRHLVTWDRRIGRRPAPAGRYTVAVEARNRLGVTGLRTTARLGGGGGSRFTLSASQLRINQRIGQAAIRRLDAVEAALDRRPPREFPGAGGRVRLSACQLLINQRIFQAAIRRAAGLEARLDGRPAPRPGPGARGRVRLSLTQLIVNQRIAQAAVRRADRLAARTG